MTLLQPSVGLPDFWAGSGFEDKLLQAQGDFSLDAGQYSVTYLPSSDTAMTGRYQVLLYDNNFGTAESYPKFDWGQLGAAVVTDYSKGTHSFGRIFTVDEAARLRARRPDRRAVFGLCEQCPARRRFEQHARGFGPGQDLHRVRSVRSGHHPLRDRSRKVYLPRVQVRAVGLCLGLTNGV